MHRQLALIIILLLIYCGSVICGP